MERTSRAMGGRWVKRADRQHGNLREAKYFLGNRAQDGFVDPRRPRVPVMTRSIFAWEIKVASSSQISPVRTISSRDTSVNLADVKQPLHFPIANPEAQPCCDLCATNRMIFIAAVAPLSSASNRFSKTWRLRNAATQLSRWRETFHHRSFSQRTSPCQRHR